MFRRALVAVVLTAAALTVGAAPAQAQLPPTPGEYLVVFAYFSDHTKTHLVGQRWHGCGQPPGSWGTTTIHRELHFPPCGPDSNN